MARKHKFLDVLQATIEEIKKTNKKNPKEETAEPSVFDLIKDKIKQVNDKVKASAPKETVAEQKPKNVFDIIKEKIEEARKENQANPDQKTAPGSIFDKLKKRVEKRQQKTGKRALKDLLQAYGVDISKIKPELLQQLKAQYQEDLGNLNEKYARLLGDLANRG